MPGADKPGWFCEQNEEWPGQAFCLKVKNDLYKGRTMFQDVLVFESESYGNVLALDGVIQASEKDEFAYQEMLTHIPLQSHPCPRRVLIIGGGDGGCLREVLKHSCVEHVDLVEIDKSVLEISRKYLPQMACELDNPRAQVHVCDGFKYLAEHQAAYDVIISDTSDPEGPAEVLFQHEYFQLCHRALRKGGLVAMQASENIWLKIEVLTTLQKRLLETFAQVNYATVLAPTYTSGQLGIFVCASDTTTNLKASSRPCEIQDNLRYYNPRIHESSFELPTFARRYIS